MKIRLRALSRKIAIYSVLMFICIALLFPIYWAVVVSLMKRVDIITWPPKLVPSNPTLKNYMWIFRYTTIPMGMRNSLMVASSTAILTLILAAFAAYALARFNVKGKQHIEYWILTTRMMPVVSVVIPFYMIWRLLNLYDTLFALVITYTALNLPFAIWLLKGSFEGVPREVEEAAIVDGCSPLQVFFKISLPLSAPGLLITIIFTFIVCWNEFFMAFVLTARNQTLTVTIASFMTHGLELKWGEMAAAGVIGMLPGICFAPLIRKYLILGLVGYRKG